MKNKKAFLWPFIATVLYHSAVASPGFGARGAQVEAPRGVSPLPRKLFEFLHQNGEFWCIVGSN